MIHRTSRRSALKAAAATLAFPTFVPAATNGANSRMNIGLIGAGKQGDHHLGQIKHHKDARIAAVAEPYARFRDKAVASWGGAANCTGFNDFRELLARPDIDAVLIATPDHWHAIQAVQAAAAGKDIFCEKPLSLTIAEARAMVTAARRYGRVFQTGSMQRSSGEFRRACELVRNGYIGRLKAVYAAVGGPATECDLPAEPTPEGFDWEMWLGPAPARPFHSVLRPPHNDSFPNWRAYRDYSGGGLTDWGAHHFDIAQWGMGTDDTGPVEIIPPGKDTPLLTMRYASGVPLYHYNGSGAGKVSEPAKGHKGVNGVLFVGEEGWVEVNRGHIQTEPASLRYLTFKASDQRLYSSDNHHADWLKCIRTRQRPICDVEIGARSVSVCHLAGIAYRLGRPLRWDPAKEIFPGDPEASRHLHRAYREPWSLT